MTTERLWNITDHPNTPLPPEDFVVFDQRLRPGRYINVPTEVLDESEKLKRDVAAGILYRGYEPPADYLAAKGAVRAERAPGSFSGHGEHNIPSAEPVATGERKAKRSSSASADSER